MEEKILSLTEQKQLNCNLATAQVKMDFFRLILNLGSMLDCCKSSNLEYERKVCEA